MLAVIVTTLLLSRRPRDGTSLMKIRHCGGRLLNLGESYRLPHGAYTERLHARRFRRNQTTRCRSQSISCWFSA